MCLLTSTILLYGYVLCDNETVRRIINALLTVCYQFLLQQIRVVSDILPARSFQQQFISGGSIRRLHCCNEKPQEIRQGPGSQQTFNIVIYIVRKTDSQVASEFCLVQRSL